MKLRWMSWALAGWLGWATLSPAQYLPSPVGAARIIDPTPTAPSTVNDKLPPLIDGPMNAQIAPPGPPDSLSLPANHTSAFMADCWGQDNGLFIHIGTIALVREPLKHGALAYQDLTGPDAVNFLGLPAGKTGDALQNFRDIGVPLRWGMRGSVGYFWGGQSIEATAFGIFQNEKTLVNQSQDGIFSFFYNAPPGFAGNNGLWLEADRMVTRFNWSLFSSELNYRYASASVLEIEIILGVRWVQLREHLSVATIDDLTGPPTDAATYAIATRNNTIAPQIGWEWARNLKWIGIGFTGKAAVGANFSSVDNSLFRGDGFEGFAYHRSATHLAGVFDMMGYVDLHLLDRLHLRGGYTTMWLTGITLARDQFDFNLGNPSGRTDNNGSLFLHGPSIELQFLF